jgi:transporter family-2 protein
MLLSLLAGVASSTQGLFNGYWKERLDLKTVMLANTLVILLLVLLLYLPSLRTGLRVPLERMSPSILVGGLCGFFIVLAFAIAFPVLGATTTSLLYLIGLLAASMLFDAGGVMGLPPSPLTLQKLAGAALALFGTYLVLRS